MLKCHLINVCFGYRVKHKLNLKPNLFFFLKLEAEIQHKLVPHLVDYLGSQLNGYAKFYLYLILSVSFFTSKAHH